MSEATAITSIEPARGNRWSWAAYLGASWTWCIGMFLPVLLIRDYGPWAWLIFAVPNAVGAAAMGWVMRSQQMSRQYTINHASAGRLFSFVTIAFQLFFSLWMLPKLVGPAGYIGAIILVQSAFTPLTKTRWLTWGGAIALLVSIIAATGMAQQHALGWPAAMPIHAGDAIGLLLVCLAGFLTCPYLDLTFHRGRIETNDHDAKFAFGVGFCVLFLSMIVITYFYATALRGIAATGDHGLTHLAAALLAIHLTLQMTYTVHVHGAELIRQGQARDDASAMRAGLGFWLAIGLAAGLGADFAASNQLEFHLRSIGEVLYRVFMSAYGLLFPAYVLLAIGRRHVSTATWLLIVAIAMPFYWIAFIEGRMAWAAAGVAVLVVGVLIARQFKPAVPVEPTE